MIWILKSSRNIKTLNSARGTGWIRKTWITLTKRRWFHPSGCLRAMRARSWNARTRSKNARITTNLNRRWRKTKSKVTIAPTASALCMGESWAHSRLVADRCSLLRTTNQAARTQTKATRVRWAARATKSTCFSWVNMKKRSIRAASCEWSTIRFNSIINGRSRLRRSVKKLA